MFTRTIAVLRNGAFTPQQRREAIAEISQGYETRFQDRRLVELFSRGLPYQTAQRLVELDKESFADEQFEKIVAGNAQHV